MKTLDEVIKALEYCLNPVDNFGNCNAECPYIHCCDPSNHDVTEDALYYLKWFWARDSMSRKLDREDNEPLTWSELKKMVGNPIYVECEVFPSRWFLIEEIGVNDSMMCVGKFTERIPLYLETMGTMWNAYRKERE